MALSAGCGLTPAIPASHPGYDTPITPTLPLLFGTFFTSQSIVSQVSVASSTPFGFFGSCSAPFMMNRPSEP